jgi:transcriptional regulator with XRE-family HTH domain
MQKLTSTLSITLRQMRQARRFSQLELSLKLGVSQCHISFVESGRAKPSRELLMAWLQELEVPLVVRNEAMLEAGYAPTYSAALLSDPALTQVNNALEHLLCTHDPMPALVIDAHWNLLRSNQGGQWLANTLVPWATGLADTVLTNVLDLLIHPEGLTKSIVNLSEVGPALLAHLRQAASIHAAIISAA